MLIDCPGCAKSYHISRAALGPQGRNVVCPHCLTSWFAAPEVHGIASRDAEDADDGFAAQMAVQPEIDAEFFSERTREPTYEELYGTMPKTQPVAAPPARRSGLPRAVLALPVILGMTTGLIAFRSTIVTLWPKANAVYAAAGFPVNTRGLDLQHVHVNLVHNGAQPLLVVDGEIANRRADKSHVPKLELVVRDAEGHDIYSWDAASPKAKLDGGETIAFRARLAAPPANGQDVFVRFAAADVKPER
jgi:predicted Zn finger-like uncharacterized protein